jgi:type VI secretion system protein ImpL
VARPDALLNGAVPTCYDRGLEIAEATFPAGATEPNVTLEMNVHGASHDITEVTLEVDGARQTYAAAPGPWLTVTWPAKTSPLAALKITGKPGVEEEILRPGPFAIFRLLDAATKLEVGTEGGQPAAPRCLVATYHLRSRPGTIELDLRSSTNKAVLASYVTRRGRLFTPYRCPRELFLPR